MQSVYSADTAARALWVQIIRKFFLLSSTLLYLLIPLFLITKIQNHHNSFDKNITNEKKNS